MLKVTVGGEHELRQLSNDLRRAKGNLRAETTAALRKAGRSTLVKVKAQVLTMQMTGYPIPGARRRFTGSGGEGGIRRRIARVTELDVSTGGTAPRIVFVVRAERLGNARGMPQRLDSGKVFRHPVMGNRQVWAGQKGQPWFRKTIVKALPRIRGEVAQAAERVARKVRG